MGFRTEKEEIIKFIKHKRGILFTPVFAEILQDGKEHATQCKLFVLLWVDFIIFRVAGEVTNEDVIYITTRL